MSARTCVAPGCGRRLLPQRCSVNRRHKHGGRNLCVPCYGVHDYAGTLVDHERSNRSRDEVMAEWELLRSEGYGKRQAAERLGMTYTAFDRAFWRARAAGDPRATTQAHADSLSACL